MMATTKSKSIQDQLVEKRKQAAELGNNIAKVEKQIAKALEEQFKAQGGCSTCRGRGWVVTWDTMDSMSGCYAEYGKCSNPECTEESRTKSGMHPLHTMYDRNHGVSHPVHESSAYKAVVAPLAKLSIQLHEEILSLEREDKYISKGDTVVIVKGRKAPVGFTGKLFWMKASEWGMRVGVKDSSDKVEWTYLSNLSNVASY